MSGCIGIYFPNLMWNSKLLDQATLRLHSSFCSCCCFLRLRDTGLALRFVTNTTKESKSTLLSRLKSLGFHINENEVFTSLTAARRLIEAKNYRPFCLLEDDALNDFEGISMDDPNAVVVGLSPKSFNYQTLNKAFRWVTKIQETCFLLFW